VVVVVVFELLGSLHVTFLYNSQVQQILN